MISGVGSLWGPLYCTLNVAPITLAIRRGGSDNLRAVHAYPDRRLGQVVLQLVPRLLLALALGRHVDGHVPPGRGDEGELEALPGPRRRHGVAARPAPPPLVGGRVAPHQPAHPGEPSANIRVAPERLGHGGE